VIIIYLFISIYQPAHIASITFDEQYENTLAVRLKC